MASLRHKHTRRGQRHFIRIQATPKSAATRALLKRITKEVNAFAKKWRTAAKKSKGR